MALDIVPWASAAPARPLQHYAGVPTLHWQNRIMREQRPPGRLTRQIHTSTSEYSYTRNEGRWTWGGGFCRESHLSQAGGACRDGGVCGV